MPKPNTPSTYALWQRLNGNAFGRWLFSKLVCFKAPYFGSISPRITQLSPTCCVATIKHRRCVQNHIGTVHAIAMCNVAELCAGMLAEASIPADMRWIPKGMQVKYLQKAVGTLTATATPAQALESKPQGYSVVVNVQVQNTQLETVFTADIELWLSPKPVR